MADKKQVLNVLKSNKAMVRTIMKDGLYTAQKVNDNYVILSRGSDGKYSQLPEGQTKTQDNTVIVLNDVKNLANDQLVTVAVEGSFVSWALKTNFAFRVTEGKTKLELNPMTDKQAKAYLQDEA